MDVKFKGTVIKSVTFLFLFLSRWIFQVRLSSERWESKEIYGSRCACLPMLARFRFNIFRFAESRALIHLRKKKERKKKNCDNPQNILRINPMELSINSSSRTSSSFPPFSLFPFFPSFFVFLSLSIPSNSNVRLFLNMARLTIKRDKSRKRGRERRGRKTRNIYFAEWLMSAFGKWNRLTQCGIAVLSQKLCSSVLP